MKRSKIGIYLIMFIFALTLSAGIIMDFAHQTTANDLEIEGIESSTDEGVSKNEIFITYSTLESTNQDVIATFVTSNPDIVITNNDGKNTFVFDSNGKFDFEFENTLTGESGVMTAVVSWIDKVVEPVKIVYDFSKPVNHSVKATLIPEEEITVLNNDYEVKDEFGNTILGDPFEYVFDENGEFIFEFEDNAGNKGSAVAKVDWIDKVTPIATVKYNVTSESELPVMAVVDFDEKDVFILNNDGKNYYVFEDNGEFIFDFSDEAGNVGSIVASVNWIKKVDTEEVLNPTPEEESKTNKPNTSSSSKPVVKVPSISKSETQEDNDESDTKEIIYKKFITENIEVEINADVVDDSLSLKKNVLSMTSSLIEKYNSQCDYFEFFFVNSRGNKEDILVKDNMVVTILLDGTRAFEELYVVSENGETEKAVYKIVNGNKLEINTNSFSEYLVVYKTAAVQEEDNSSAEEEYIKNEINVGIVICSCVIGLVILMAIVCVFIKE